MESNSKIKKKVFKLENDEVLIVINPKNNSNNLIVIEEKRSINV